MATLPTLDEKVRLALDCFKAYSVRPGGALQQGVFVAWSVKKNVPHREVLEGIQEGATRGFFDQKTPNGGVFLTADGFAAM